MVQPAAQPMMVVIPDGVAPGSQFSVQTPSGIMSVQCPPTSKPGDQIQVLVPTVPMASAATVPMGGMVTNTMPHPAATGMDGAVPSAQGSICTLPQVIRKGTGDHRGVKTFTDAEYSTGRRYATGSPDAVHSFVAPNLNGILCESDFSAALMLSGLAGAPDPFAPYVSGRRELDLDADVDGRVAEALDRMKKNCAAYIGCALICPVFGCCVLLSSGKCGQRNQGGCGENAYTEALRESANATRLYLTSDAVVFECAAHTTEVIQNAASFDQYGHRYPVSATTKVQVPATKISVPLGRAEVVVVPAKDVVGWPPFYDAMGQMCYSEIASEIVAVRVGDGIKTVVACVEVGKDSTAASFAEKCNRAARSAPPESPELTAAFNAWLLERLSKTGRMTGGGPTPQAMSRVGPAQPFIKAVGPLPENLGVAKNVMSRNTLKGLANLEIAKAGGQIYKPRHGNPLLSQLNAGDQIVSCNGVPRTGQANHAWLDEVVAAGARMPPGQPRYMQVISRMPYFQPNQLLTVSVPPGLGLDQLGLDPGGGPGGQKPPKLTGQSPVAQSLGCRPGDVIVQAIVDGATHDATSMTAGDLIAAASGASAVQLTLLQPTLTPDAQHTISWPVV